MERLLQHHINETGKRFDDLGDRLEKIDSKLSELQEFKVKMVVDARWVSLLVSAVCGFATMIATTVLEYFIYKSKP